MVPTQGRYDDGLDQSYGYEDGENEQDSGCNLVMNRQDQLMNLIWNMKKKEIKAYFQVWPEQHYKWYSLLLK